MTFELPALPYPAEALEPHVSARTFEYHHGKHHQAYVTNLNNLIKDTPLAVLSLEEIIKQTAKDDSKTGVFNNAAQVWNHSFFWNCQARGGGDPTPEVLQKIVSAFGSLDAFKEEFKQAGVTQFGSGWIWLVEEAGEQDRQDRQRHDAAGRGAKAHCYL